MTITTIFFWAFFMNVSSIIRERTFGVIPEELEAAPPGKKDNVRIKVRLPIS
jgi:high-affinity Fe2+/Pb2+ permease